MASIVQTKMKQLIITELLWRRICFLADESLPEEACGLLSGIDQQVHEVISVPNLLHSPVRYRMDPVQQIWALNHIEERGMELAGIFHSHPSGPDRPSETDIAESYYPDSAYVILFPVESKWKARAFMIAPPQVNEIPLIITMDI